MYSILLSEVGYCCAGSFWTQQNNCTVLRYLKIAVISLMFCWFVDRTVVDSLVPKYIALLMWLSGTDKLLRPCCCCYIFVEVLIWSNGICYCCAYVVCCQEWHDNILDRYSTRVLLLPSRRCYGFPVSFLLSCCWLLFD